MFIVLDGPEGAGKSTQIRLLIEQIRGLGREVLGMRDPGATRIGEKVREILLDPANSEMGIRCEMLLYMAARAQMMDEHILPALSAGKVVVCDRFVSSTLAYQGGNDGIAASDIRAVAEVAIRGRWPDLTVIMDLPAGAGLGRVKRDKDRIEQRSMAYHDGVRGRFLELAMEMSGRYWVVDASRDVESVRADIWGKIEGMVKAG